MLLNQVAGVSVSDPQVQGSKYAALTMLLKSTKIGIMSRNISHIMRAMLCASGSFLLLLPTQTLLPVVRWTVMWGDCHTLLKATAPSQTRVIPMIYIHRGGLHIQR